MDFITIIIMLLVLMIAPVRQESSESPPTVVESSAQVRSDSATRNAIWVNDFTVTFNGPLANNVSVTEQTGTPVDEASPGFSDAPTTLFMFDGALQNASLRIYKMTDLAQYDFMQARVDELQNLIDTQADLNAADTLPQLPIYTHGQVIKARAQHHDTGTLRGISYLTAYQAAAEPFISDSFTFVFQGMTTDGMYYVSFLAPVTTTLYSDELPTDFDLATFVDNLDAYLADETQTLNNAPDDAFTPQLNAVLDLILSMNIRANQ